MTTRMVTSLLLPLVLSIVPMSEGTTQPMEQFLPGIQSALPSPWTFNIDTPSDSTFWPRGLSKPLFCATFRDTVHLITDCHSTADNPYLKICFYPRSLRAAIETIIGQQSNFSWCIPVKYLESTEYFIVTSPCYINNGCFTTDSKALIAPLDSALASYFTPKVISRYDSIIVDPHVFSGRMDPRFIIRDSVNIRLLQWKIDSVTTAVTLNGTLSTKIHSWWPGMRITYCLPIYSSRMYYPLEMGVDSIACVYPSGSRVVSVNNRDFQQCIIDILIKENPLSIRGTDTIKAAELFTNYSPFTGVLSEKQKPRETFSGQYPGSLLTINGTVLELTLDSPQMITVELFNYKGQLISTLYNDILHPGSSRIALPRNSTAYTMGILRVQSNGQTHTVPAVILVK